MRFSAVREDENHEVAEGHSAPDEGKPVVRALGWIFVLTLAQSVPLTRPESAAVAAFLFGVVFIIGGILLLHRKVNLRLVPLP